MRKADRDTLDKQVQELAQRYGSINTNAVSQHLKKKWETVQSAINRLVDAGVLYYISGTKSPKVYSIYPSAKEQRTRKDMLADLANRETETAKQESETENRETDNVGYARPTIPYRRALHPDEVAPIIGFVCHPAVDKSKVTPQFMRCHWAGAFVVDVVNRGATYETYVTSDGTTTGGWVVRPMSGNLSLHGHIRLPADPDKFTMTAMTKKDGSISKLSVRVHSRYIFAKSSDVTAVAEFLHQTNDVLDVLRSQGWTFGEIHYDVKDLHRAIASVRFANALPENYTENPNDVVHYDRSHGTPEGEIYGVDDNNTVEFFGNPMAVIDGITARLDQLDSAVDKLLTITEKVSLAVTRMAEVQTSQIIATPFDNGGRMYG